MKKVILILAVILLSVSLFCDDIASNDYVPNISVDPLSPEFNLNQGENLKEIDITNNSDIPLVCTPVVKDDSNFVNPEYSLTGSIFMFPSSVTLSAGQSSKIKMYLYHLDNLKGDGEFDSVLSVDTKAITENSGSSSTTLNEAGVVKAYRGICIQKMSISNVNLNVNIPLTIAEQYTLTNHIGAKVGSTLDLTINNVGNVHSPYVLDVNFLDNTGKVIDSCESSGSVIRGNSQAVHIATGYTNISKCEITLYMHDINSGTTIKIDSIIVNKNLEN